jgi:hypothetical protein
MAWSILSIEQWASMTLEEWAGLLIDPTATDPWMVPGAETYLPGAQSIEVFEPGAQAAEVV